MESQALRTGLWTGLGRKGRMGCMERVTRRHILPCKADTQRGLALCFGELTQGGDGVGGGRAVQVGGDMGKPMADSC